MSEPTNRKAQSVSQVPNSETKSCETCKHKARVYLRMIGGNREKVRLCEVTASFTPYYGMDGCAYEPIKGDNDGD